MPLLKVENIDRSRGDISIGIPNFNHGATLERAVLSALESSRVREIVFYDNASTDNSLEIIKKIKSERSDVIIKVQDRVYNVGASRNFYDCANLASSKYFAWLPSDDYVSPGYYDNLAEFLDINVEMSLCSGNTVIYNNNGFRLVAKSNRDLIGDKCSRINSFLSSPDENQWFYGLFRSDFLNHFIGKMKDEIACDWFVMCRILEKTEIKVISDSFIYRYETPLENYFSPNASESIKKAFLDGKAEEIMLPQIEDIMKEGFLHKKQVEYLLGLAELNTRRFIDFSKKYSDFLYNNKDEIMIRFNDRSYDILSNIED